LNRLALGSSIVIAFALLGNHAAVAAPPSWVSTGGPVGGLGYDVRIHPANKQMMFVTDNYAGVNKSIDRGMSWQPANTGITVRGGPSGDAHPIFSLTIDPNDPNIVWAGTNGDLSAFGVFKSTNGGAQWVLKTSGITDGGFGIVFRGFTVQPGNSSVVYAQAELHTGVQGKEFERTKGCVYKTTNGGDSWTLLWAGDSLARHLIIDSTQPLTLYLSTGIFDREAYNSDCAAGVAGGVGVLKSTDGGASWVPINSGLTDLYVGALRMHPSNPQVLFAATGNNACTPQFLGIATSGLFRTTNGGGSWDRVIGGDIFTTVGFSPSSPNTVYAASARSFYRSSDGGTSWQPFTKASGADWGPAGIRAGVPIDVTVDPDDPNTLYANNYGGGVFASTDGSKSWQVWSRGYSGAEIHSIAVPDTRPTAVYAIGRSGPFVSPNYGLDWAGIGNGDAVFPEWNTVVTQPGNPDVAIISDEHQGFILRSKDGGATFTVVFHHPNADPSVPAHRQGFKALAFAPSQASVVYAGMAKDRGTIDTSVPVGPVFYRSIDGGLTFTAASADLDGSNVHRLVVDRANADTLWAATSRGVYASVNAGTHWTLLGLGGQNVIAVAVNPLDRSALVASVKNIGIFVSADGGASWPGGPFNTGFTNANPAVMALVFEQGTGALYAGDFYSGVYRSTDGGRSWAGFPDAAMTGLQMRAVKDIALAGGVLYAATQGGGVLRYGGPSIIPTPSAADFGTVTVGSSSAARTFTLYNTGAASRALLGKATAGAGAADFSVRNDTCPPSLGPSASCTFDVVFTPFASGMRSAILNVSSDDPFGPTYPIDIRGSGLQPVTADAGASTDGGPADALAGGGWLPDGGADGPSGDGGVADVSVAGAGPDDSSVADRAGPAAGNGEAMPSAPSRPSQGGCNCTLGSAQRSAGAWHWVLLFAVVVAHNRRGNRRQSNAS
jgi:hypothetical protein